MVSFYKHLVNYFHVLHCQKLSLILLPVIIPRKRARGWKMTIICQSNIYFCIDTLYENKEGKDH